MNPSIREEYQRILMCYLDEKYADSGVSKELQVISLTGVYLPADRVIEFRRRLYSLLADIFLHGATDSRILGLVPCHASELFKDAEKSDGTGVTDEDRLEFLRKLVSIVNEMDLDVVRFGYRRNDGMENLSSALGKDFSAHGKGVLGMLFHGFFPPRRVTNHDSKSERYIGSEEPVVFYCMEDDGSAPQRRIFHENTYVNMWYRELLGANNMSVAFDQVGDVLSYKKGDPLGVLPDCIGYILHQKWLRERGHHLTRFKSHMAAICEAIRPELLHETIIDIEYNVSSDDRK